MLARNHEALMQLMKTCKIGKGLRERVVLPPETSTDWDNLDFLVLRAKGGSSVLIYEDKAFVVEMNGPLRDNASGRLKTLICDFCFTWQAPGSGGRLTFIRKNHASSVSHLCCLDLQCSLHVRGLTKEAQLSRTQLREDITPEERIARLHNHLTAITNTVLAG